MGYVNSLEGIYFIDPKRAMKAFDLKAVRKLWLKALTCVAELKTWGMEFVRDLAVFFVVSFIMGKTFTQFPMSCG